MLLHENEGVLGCETPPIDPDDGEIRHLLPRLLHGKELVCLTEQGEVGPKDTAQEPHAIDDHLIINDPGQPPVLSLGVFGLKKNADGLLQRVKRLGFPAKTEARYRERTIFWVYAEQSSEDELLRLLEEAEFGDGISQIPTQCLPT